MLFLLPTTVGASLLLRGGPEHLSTLAHHGLLNLENSATLVDRLLDDAVNQTEVYKAIDQSAAQFTDFGSLDLPGEVSTLLTGSGANAKLDEKAVKKATKVLNTMMENAQTELDEKLVECKGQKNGLRTLIDQATTDVARLASVITDLGRQELEAIASLQEQKQSIELLGEEARSKETAYKEVKKANEAALKIQKNDLEVAEFILNVSKCPKSFMQLMNTPVVEQCEEEGKATASFVDKNLHKMVTSLTTVEQRNQVSRLLMQGEMEDFTDVSYKSEAGAEEEGAGADVDCTMITGDGVGPREAFLKVVSSDEECVKLVRKMEPTANGATIGEQSSVKNRCYAEFGQTGSNGSAAWRTCVFSKKPAVKPADVPSKKPSSKPASARKQSKKCRVARVDCGLLHDNMSILWGDYKDQVEETESIIAKDDGKYSREKAAFQERKGMLVTALSTANTGLAEARSHSASLKQEQAKTEGEHRGLVRKLNGVIADCRATTQHLLFNSICGLKSVRGSLLAKAKPDLMVSDCEVGNWVVGPCSKPCDDSNPNNNPDAYGGWTTLTREVVSKNTKLYGQACPALSMRMRCGQFPCPKNCEMGPWSGWSKCTAECGGGVQSKSRAVTRDPENGGTSCDSTTESRPCNSGSCDRDCTLKKWTKRPCSMSCGGGRIVKRKAVKIPMRGNGKCPNNKSRKRLLYKKCNKFACRGDEICIAKQDTVIALDGSGSVRKKGFEVLKRFASTLVRQFKGRVKRKVKGKGKGKKKRTASRVGIVQFGNGELNDKGEVSSATIVSKLSRKIKQVSKKVEGLKWPKGFTNMAQAFSASNTVFMNGRKKAQSVIVVITDGRPSFVRATDAMVEQQRRKGVKVVIVMVKAFPTRAMKKLMMRWASKPAKSFLLHVPGLKNLEQNMSLWVNKVLVRSCSKAKSKKRRANKRIRKKNRKNKKKKGLLQVENEEEHTEDEEHTADDEHTDEHTDEETGEHTTDDEQSTDEDIAGEGSAEEDEEDEHTDTDEQSGDDKEWEGEEPEEAATHP